MTPLLFPYTILTAEMVALAARFLPSLTLYQPIGGQLPDELQSWVNRGFLNISIPVPDDEATVASAADEYQLWAQQYQPGKELKTIRPGGGPSRPPFFDESAPSQILTELKGGDADTAEDAPRLFSARLFLCLAQNLDLHRNELRRHLDQVEADSDALMEELKPAEGLESISERVPPGISPEDASDFMLSERFIAWTNLFLADQVHDAFLVTTSLPIFTDFVNSSDGARLLTQVNLSDWTGSDESSEPGCQASLLTEIYNAAVQPIGEVHLPDKQHPERKDDHPGLTIYVIPDRSLRAYLAEVAGLSYSEQIHPRPEADRPRNIVVGFLDPGRMK